VRDSVKQGCKLTYGSPEMPKGFSDGNWFEACVLENINKNSRAYNEELFGPIFSLFKVKTDAEAIELANDSVYGLGGAVFSKDT
jgi:succinate-semialdehyde dehydrogenase/glutarate-semialdehyde dehydrogenase